MEQLKCLSTLQRFILNWAMSASLAANRLKNAGQPIPTILGLRYAFGQKYIFPHLKEALGLSNVTACFSGAAPISKSILEFFAGLDINIREVYGQTEGSGPTTMNVRGATKYGSVGLPIPGVEVRISTIDGEILVKGPNVFMGYFKDDKSTSEYLRDGWLHSGDIGKFDKDGYLWITERKKDIIITAGGKNIAPQNIELALKQLPFISEAVIIGDRRKYLTCLLSLNWDAVNQWAEKNKLDPIRKDRILKRMCASAISTVNKDLAQAEKIKKFRIVPRQFDIFHGELTGTMKVKRKIVQQNFKDLIEDMYK